MSALARSAAVAFIAAALGTAASAETVYRCGSTYSNAPCAGATAVDVGVAPDAAQRAEARAVAERERQLAAELVRDRHERERASRPASAASLSAARPASAAPAPAKKRGHASKKPPQESDGRDFVAVVPAPPKR